MPSFSARSPWLLLPVAAGALLLLGLASWPRVDAEVAHDRALERWESRQPAAYSFDHLRGGRERLGWGLDVARFDPRG
ncbi:hypothetical protein [Nocardioides solisilvae]|uniref:hypothetical protein n=1 Tax=Nocardioides solisilvae TaxID=1542435 RepID=UPI000D74A2E0|nr:hypothetical protein [Nocardioides solisilvae]